MKKKLVTMILAVTVAVSVLAGCSKGDVPAVSENLEESDEEPVEEPTEEPVAEPEPEPEPECIHEWTEATFVAPKTCTLCGETEGERRQSYFEEHGMEVPNGPVSCTVDGVITSPDNPEKFQKVVDSVWEQIDCYIEPAEEEGYQLVHLEMTGTIPYYYDAAENRDYLEGWIDFGVYDWYTGQRIPYSDIQGDGSFEIASILEVDGASYEVSYILDVQWEQDDWVYDDAGNGSSNMKGIQSHVFKVPEGYDGLVFAVIPQREYRDPDTETVQGMEEVEYAHLDETDQDYIEGIKYFRINQQEDSAIMSGENAVSGATSDSASDAAVDDDSRE
ncbi:MAG: hypothetical protein OSJ60_07060 [Lachnospiraceae bacterium]|nr:hypothetical protein [Lachnospiraceae bacterium]